MVQITSDMRGFFNGLASSSSSSIGQHNTTTRCYGKYNQRLQNRNAQVKEQEAEILDTKLNLDLQDLIKN